MMTCPRKEVLDAVSSLYPVYTFIPNSSARELPPKNATFYLLVLLHAHGAIPIRPPNTLLPFKLLPLPDLDLLLALLQRLLAGPPRRLTMRRRHRDEDALLADGHRAEPVDHGDPLEAVFGGYRFADGEHAAQGERLVGRVLQLLDGFASEVVTRCPWEGISVLVVEGMGVYVPAKRTIAPAAGLRTRSMTSWALR